MNIIKRENIRKLPTEIITNYILPYTYGVKPKNLLLDIRTFRTDFNILMNLYAFSYNYRILLFDLLYFCNNSIYTHDSVTLKLRDLFKRNYILSKYTNNELLYFIYENFHSKKQRKKTLSQIKFIFGLMTQPERSEFIYTVMIE
jgi:predicted helicase